MNRRNPKEYFVIQALNHSNWYPTHNVAGHPMDIGLAIWHVVEDDKAPMSPWFRLVQADGIDLMNDTSTKSPTIHQSTTGHSFQKSSGRKKGWFTSPE